MKKSDFLKQQYNNKITEAEDLFQNGKIEEANNAMDEADKIKAQLDVQMRIENADGNFNINDGNITDPTEGNDSSEGDLIKAYTGELFYKALTGQSLNDEERNILNKVKLEQKAALSEKDGKDGGLTVPPDLSKEIIESIKEEESVRNLIRVEPVKSKTGSRLIRKGKPNKLYNTEERQQIQEMNNAEFASIEYNQHKYAGLMDVPNELLDDSFLNFKEEMKQWMADSSRETENELMFYGTGGKDPIGIFNTTVYYKELEAPATIDIKFLRKMKNSIKQGYRKNAVWVMNTDAQELIAGIEDKNGRGILCPDPRNEDTFTLFGRPVEIYDTVKTTEEGKTEIAFGDFKRGYRMFARKDFEFKLTDTGAGAFETDTVKARGIERFDGQRMDSEAIVIARNVVASVVKSK